MTKKYLYLLTLLLLCNSVYAQTWQQVPIRTAVQKNAGFSGGEGLQAIQDIKYAPSNANILYMVIDTSGVWKSINGGTNWQMVLNGYSSNGGQCLNIHPTNPNIVFVAGSNMSIGGPGATGSLKGIFKTTDGGNNWSMVKATTYLRTTRSKGASLFAFSGANTVYAGTHGEGLLKSTDGGNTWATIVSSPNYITDIKMHPTDSTIIYMCTTSGLYKVVDSGSVTTTKIGTGLPQSPYQIAIDGDTPSTMYVTVGNYGVYRSTNNGSNFSARNNGMSAIISAGYSAYNIAISPADPNYLFVSFNYASTSSPYGYFYSHDGGANWIVPTDMDVGDYISSYDTWLGNVIGHTYVSTTGFHPTDKNIAMTFCNGEMPRKTTDGGLHWTYSGSGYTGGACGNPGAHTPIGWDKNNPSRFFLFLADSGPYYTTDDGDTFVRRKCMNSLGWGSTNVGAIDYTSGSQIVVTASGSWEQQRIMISRNLGINWTEITGMDAQYLFIAFSPTNANVVYAGKYKFTSIQTNNNYSTLSKTVCGVYSGNGDIVYSTGYVSGSTTVYKSTNGGSTWTTPYPTIPASGQIGQVAIAPDNENRIYIAMKGTTPSDKAGIWIINDTSANGGTATLKDYNNGLAKDQFGEMNYYSVAVDPKNPNVVYAAQYSRYKGASNGVFRSTDYGDTWSNVSGNLTTWFTPNCLTVNPYNGYVYVGSFFGTWKLPPPSGEPEPPTRLTYDVEKINAGAVTVDGNLSEWELHNSIGKTLSGAPVSIGTWSAKWIDGSAGGLYFAIQVSDVNQYSDSGTSTPYLDDSVELYLDRDNNKGSTYDSYDRNIKFVYGSNTTMTINTGTTTGILQGGSNTPSLWTKEIFVPWSIFPGGAVPSLGTIIGFDVQLNDDNDGGTREGAKSWNNTTDTNYYNTSNFGEVQLQGYDYDIYDGCTVSTSGLIAHFAMNESAGTTTHDFSYRNNTGTITGALFVAGKSGNALDFDGIDDSLSFPNESYYDIQRTDSLSMSAWIKIGTSASDQVIVTKILNGTPYSGYSFTVDTNGYFYTRLCYVNNTNLLEKYASSVVNDNSWHHIAFTYNGSSTASGLNLYLDGNLSNGTVTYNTLSASILNNQKLTIGNHGGGGAATNGLIDDVRIYTRELTSDEISCLYNNTSLLSVQSTNPGSGTAGVSLSSNVDATFSKTLDSYWAGTVSVFTVGTVTGAVTPGTGTLQFNPTSDLNNNTTYPVTLSKRLRDTAGYPMADDYKYTFTTLAGTDTTAPMGTITLHNGATYATSTAITIDLSATDAVGVTGYFLSPGSTTPYGTQTGWVMVGTSTNYAGKIPYTLSFIDGVKTIFGWFRDGAGNISSVTQDSVVLDTVFASVVINDPSQNCSLADGTAVYGTSGSSVDIGGLAYDVNGVSQVKVSHVEFATVNSATGTDTWVRSNNIIGTTSANTLLATAYDVPGNQGTDTIHVGNFAVPVTMYAGSITSSSAILYGSVTPNLGGTVTVSFEYGIESGIYAGSSTAQLFAGTTTVKDVGTTLGVLNSETAYFYRLIATNNLGTTVSGEMSFTTEASTPAGGNSSTILRWRSYDEFHTTGFHSYLKEINKYRSFFKNIRSTQDWVDLIADPDAVLSALPAD